jgi:CheY-like chemotaxis protein
MKVILVDELPSGLMALAGERVATVLREFGHTVHVFASGREALLKFSAIGPDAVIMSEVIGRMTHEEFLNEVEKQDPERQIIRLVMTQQMPIGGPWRDWSLPCHGFVFARSAFQLLLMLEQCERRRVTW